MNDSQDQSTIETAAGVIDALGGTTAAARAGDALPQDISRARGQNRLPSSTFLLLTEALAVIGKRADPRLWGIKPGKRRD